tara:strand:+ start:114398 stop:116143 length:1746 start_codon:yes stop_codon:yes gene_type:complete
MDDEPRIAYFSMEIAVDPDVPTYSGGLGVLAGDTIRAAADLHLPMVAVTLLDRRGYFFQRLDATGHQTEEPVHWSIADFLTDTGIYATVTIEGRDVRLKAWRYDVTADDGYRVPVYFLDADLPENSDADRILTDQLYGGDHRYRLCQEVLLGIGGVRMLRSFGHLNLERFHMNEGHAALLTIELLREHRVAAGRNELITEDYAAVRRQCVFTTHTPVPAGHDRFNIDLVEQVLGKRELCGISDAICHAGQLNMTYVALALSHYVNGVAKKHSEVSQLMFAEYDIDSITNGVHAATWVSPSFAGLFDKYITNWRRDNFSLRYALSIPDNEIWLAHQLAKRELLGRVNRQTNTGFDVDVLTLGFGRRAASYKRPALLMEDIDRLRRISRDVGRLQIIYAGKAHPSDEQGKELIKQIIQYGHELGTDVPVAYLPNYDMRLGGLMTAGVDVWLNTPEPPNEASGTSGMKAALNGVPSLSVLDGWWIEGCIEGVTGWAIGHRNSQVHGANANALYDSLEESVVPMFYNDRERFIDVMRHSIALNGSFFNTQRMVHEYMVKSYSIGNPITRTARVDGPKSPRAPTLS